MVKYSATCMDCQVVGKYPGYNNFSGSKELYEGPSLKKAQEAAYKHNVKEHPENGGDVRIVDLEKEKG